MSGRIDLTLTVPKNINLNFDAPKKSAAATQQRPAPVSSQGTSTISRHEPTNKPNLVADLIDGYIGLCSYSEKDPFWRKAVAWAAGAPILYPLMLLEKMGILAFSARHSDDENIVVEKK